MRSRPTLHLAFACLASTFAGGVEQAARAQEKAAVAAKPDEAKGHPAITSLPKLPADVHDALQSRDFADAVKAIDAAIKTGTSAAADYLLYLKGRAQTELGAYDDAQATFALLETQHPKSAWVARARFGRADVFSRQRNYRAAGEIYRAEAEGLLSVGRRDELVAIYLEFADRYFDGVPAKDPSQKPQPDYANALTWYRESLKLQPGVPVRQRVEYRIARSHQELNQHNEALAAYQSWMAAYTGSGVDDSARATADFEGEVRYQHGRAQLAAGQPAEARKTWQDLLTFVAEKKAAKVVLAKEVEDDLVAEAQFRLASTYGIPQPGSVGDLELGVAALEKFLKAYPKHRLAAKAELEIAQGYAHHARYDQAVAKLKSLIANETYAKAPEVADARQLLGTAYYNQRKFTEAIAAWKEFLDKHPDNAQWSAVQQTVIDSEFQIAAEHARKKEYDAARKAWETFLNKYPLDSRAAGILFRFGQMKYAEAVAARGVAEPGAPMKPAPPKPLDDKTKALFEAAIADWSRLVSKYPGSNEASQAAYSIGVTLEDQLARLADALEAYKKVQGAYQPQAQQRIANLTAKQLEVVTERKFRSNEKPEIVVHTRNVESVSVKLYRIDLLDYFRKMHLATGVESLDIALIDPDKTIEHSVSDYENYRRHENRIAIPVDGPGVTAVTVTGEKLEATTMVVVSDLDLVVKSSRNELFVFVENMLTGKPAANVNLLVSDGAKVFAEGATNADGVLQKAYDELKSINDLRVFAAADGHSASSQLGLSGLDFAVGLSPKGYLWTDRSAYRAGQLVHLKGVVRWVENDRFTFKPGEPFQLDVYDARGRVLHTAKVALTEFGSFAANLTLPETAPQGDYRVHLHQSGKSQSYETSFAVHEFKLEPIHLTIDVPQRVFFRGEKIKGRVRLAYYYGAPLAGRPVQFRLADDRLHVETTNEAGEIAFEFDTARYSESQPLSITAQHAERNLSASETVYLATRGFDVAVSTIRPVYIAGETFDVSAAVADPAGKPVETGLKLEVFEETRIHGERGEKLIATHELKTDTEGKARQTVRLDSAGRYILRATGTDRFHNPVSGQSAVQVSGDEDKVRLRILAEQHHYKVGDTAKVQLHWREAPALALVTYEGAKILGYRLVELKPGANALDLPLGSELAPNFELAVAVMEQSRFHEARSAFRVVRKLTVALKPSATTLKPGDELKVDVTVTDPQGKPVSAEVTLGLVQRNLLDLFGDRQTAIDDFFGGDARVVSVRAATSATFRYAPNTRAVSEALLAEADRAAALELEREARERLMAQQARNQSPRLRGDPRAQLEALNKDLAGSGIELDELAQNDPNDPFGTDMEQQTEESLPQALLLLNDGQAGFGGGFLGGQMANGPGPGVPPMRRPRFGSQSGTQGVWVERSGLGWSKFGRDGASSSRWGEVRPDVGLAIRDAAEVQKIKGRLLQRLINDERFRSSKENSFWHQLDAGEQAAVIPFSASDFTSTEGRAFLGDLSKTDGTILALNGRGQFQAINGLAPAAVQELAKDGMQILLNQSASETGYWNPVVVTDKDGKATVTFRLPDRSTAWKLRAKGADKETLAGQAEVEIVSKKDLFGELKTPLAFVAGDKVSLLVEVHNSAVKKDEKIEVSLKTTLGEKSTVVKSQVDSTGPGMMELSFDVEIGSVETALFELTVASGNLRDVATVAVPVRPFGMDVFATSSGQAAQNTIAFVDFEKGLPAERPKLEIVIGPSVNRTLLDAVFGSNPLACELVLPGPRGGLERAISDILGGVALLKSVRESTAPDSPEAQTLAGRIAGAVAQLVSAQRDGGDWTWSGRPSVDKPDRYLSSRAMWALSEARRAGFAVPQATFDKGVQHLNTAFTKSVQTDREGQAILLHGLAEAGAADFAHANRLYRDRNALSTSGLLHVALVLAKLDRKEMAGEVLKLVDLPATRGVAAPVDVKVIPWMQSPVELRALYLLALQEIEPASGKSSDVADWLMGARVGSRWAPEKANGPAVAALARWFSRTKFTPENYTLSVFVNDKLVEKIAVDPSQDASRRLDVAERFLVAGKPQKINFDIEGRGNFSYSAVLSGFVPTDKLKNTSNDWTVQRNYEPAQRMLDGELIPRGFGILAGGHTSFRNPLTQLSLGERGEVTLSIWRHNVRGTPDEQLDYLIVTEPIPAGTMVLAESIQGPFERYEISAGFITFYIGDRPYVGDIRYTLVGYLPGEYQAGPTLVRSFYRPERIAVSQKKPLAVLARGMKSADEYKLSPVELFHMGKKYLAKRDDKAADEHLTKLFRDWRLDASVYQETVKLLFRTSLNLNRKDAIVEYFEIIKEKYPDVEIDYDSILKVAKAYQELGEYERSFLVYRATVEASFGREGQITGFLDGRQQFARSIETMERLLREYPAESYVATATYALAQEVYGKAAEAAGNEKLREAKISRVDLIAASLQMTEHFLSTWPKDPAADQASFAMANSHLDLEQYEQAIARCRESVERYPESKLLDSFWYIIGFSQFALEKPDDALATCRKVAEMKTKDPNTGIELAAANREQAIYIMGQVYHSLGKASQAIAEYERVKQKFPDANEAIDFFIRKEIKLPEVTTIKPGDAAKIGLDFRNVPAASVKVYRIDLLKFGLMQRNLDRITAINLAGIRPYHELTLELGDGRDYRDRKQELSLPLKEEGAYLVVCRAENLYASGLVLVSPLVLEPQEDAQSGRVRVTVKDAVADKYVHGVHVKVIGTHNPQFQSGETDLRGIFTADGICGTTTVIARSEQNRYAFHRGKTHLGPQPQPNAPAQQPGEGTPGPGSGEGKPGQGKEGLLENLRMQNSIFNNEQRMNYKRQLELDNGGVKAKSAF